MSEYGRLNLCFNLNDPRQRAAYEYLFARKRNRTGAVTDAILALTENHKEQIVTAPVSSPIDNVGLLVQIEELLRNYQQRTVNDIKDELGKVSIPKNLITIEEITSVDENVDDGDEMSDDAFAAMAAFMDF